MTEPAAPGGPPAGHLVADQREVAAFLSQPATHGGQTVERIDTHASMVFLAGDLAYKVKRAVAFPYMDFSTLGRRRAFCEKEILLNRRTAPDLYLRAMAIRRGPAGGLSLGGAGEVVEWAVVMRRFDQDSLFDRLFAPGSITRHSSISSSVNTSRPLMAPPLTPTPCPKYNLWGSSSKSKVSTCFLSRIAISRVCSKYRSSGDGPSKVNSISCGLHPLSSIRSWAQSFNA